MKRTFLMIAVLVCAAGTYLAEAGEKCYLVKIYGLDKEYRYEVMTSAQFKVADTEIKAKARLFSKALANAKKEWDKDKERKKGFPRSCASAPKLQTLKTFTDMEKANAQLSKYEDRKARSKEKDLEKEKEKSKGKDKEKIAKQKAKDAAREAFLSDARAIVEANLNDLAGGTKKKEPAKK